MGADKYMYNTQLYIGGDREIYTLLKKICQKSDEFH